jgi:hypothetical protein
MKRRVATMIVEKEDIVAVLEDDIEAMSDDDERAVSTTRSSATLL